ncbi:polysaccharide deacetylase family protein [Bordetella genomosp. 9]|uniref:polysaccharide deacetylase family protein n=1 Tax=Bordetella genomosp. 9 TaxID=1416803 RepID=UPI000A3288B4|nr:polysaccharide deacetylase family protein [Bordetella genomosp. 9]
MSIPILMYHQVGALAPRGTPFRGLTVDTASFRRQMTWMHRLGYLGLSMRDLMPYLRGERSGKVFGITFDDGFRNVHDNAMPVLADLGFTATNYFVAGQLGGSNVWDHAHGVPSSPLMTVGEMREWAAAGNEVGSHTLDHVHLPLLDPVEARRQIAGSRQALEDAIGQPVTAFCYPYGEFTEAHIGMAREAGYENATLTKRGLANGNDDTMALPRVLVAGSTGIVSFLRKMLTSYEDRKRRNW